MSSGTHGPIHGVILYLRQRALTYLTTETTTSRCFIILQDKTHHGKFKLRVAVSITVVQ